VNGNNQITNRHCILKRERNSIRKNEKRNRMAEEYGKTKQRKVANNPKSQSAPKEGTES
jgi:hypothetical protein